MDNRLFLARTEEQNKFRQVLQSFQVSWTEKHLPTFSKPFRKEPSDGVNSPHIFLLYGEGGMGKSSLSRRLEEITQAQFAKDWQAVRIDWEEERDKYLDLQVGADQIKPETVLAVLQKNLEILGGNFRDYLNAKRDLEKIEEKLDRELRAKEGAEKYRSLIGGGLGLATGLLRKIPGVDQLIASDEAAKQVKDAGTAALVGLLQEKLSLGERKLFANPTVQLAEALGRGLRELTAGKPTVIFLDTYEIVDRPDCDYVLRQVIKSAGTNIVWVIAGRADLTKSRRLADRQFRGYEQDFSERLYGYSLSEFNDQLVQEYFSQAIPNRALPTDGAARIAAFSLGIPFVVQQIAEIWRTSPEIGLDEILERSDLGSWEESSHDQVIRVTSERFLKHCFVKNAPEDLRMICAIGLLRQPDNDLLAAMLQVDNFIGAVDGLKQRHSFILLAGKGIRLHNKMEDFLREALRSESILLNLQLEGKMLQELNEFAVMSLEEQLKGLQANLPIADWYEDERITNAMLNLVHHLFWLAEERGWAYAVPRFVEAWQYDRRWGEGLLEVIDSFKENLCPLGRKRLKIFQQGFELSFYEVFGQDTQLVLDELAKISRQKNWLQGEGQEEREAILSLKQGQIYQEQKKYTEAFRLYLEAEKHLTKDTVVLLESLGKAFNDVSYSLCYGEKPEYEMAILGCQKARKTQPQNELLWFREGFALNELGKYEEAIASYDKALEIKPDDHDAWNNRGNSLGDLGRNEEAIASYDKALEIKPDYHEAWYNRGCVLRRLGREEEAITSFDKALEIKPDYHGTWNNRGNSLGRLGREVEAITSFDKALEIKPDCHEVWYNKACCYALQNQIDLALEFLPKAIELDAKFLEMAKTDSDFDSIREDPRFQTLIFLE